VLDIPDEAHEYEKNSAVNGGSYGKGEIDPEEHASEKLSMAELEAAAAASAKSDKYFNLFKRATAANSCQVQSSSCSVLSLFSHYAGL